MCIWKIPYRKIIWQFSFMAVSWKRGQCSITYCLSVRQLITQVSFHMDWILRKINHFEDEEPINHEVDKDPILTRWDWPKQLSHKTLPKAQRTRGLSSAYQINLFRSCHKLHKSWLNIFRISTKHQLQNLNQTSAFRQKLNLKILTRPSFRISTKIELHNHNQASVAK